MTLCKRIVLSSCSLSVHLSNIGRDIYFLTRRCYDSEVRKIRFTRKQLDFILSEDVQGFLSYVIEEMRNNSVDFLNNRDNLSGYKFYQFFSKDKNDGEGRIYGLKIDDLEFEIYVEKCDGTTIEIAFINKQHNGETLWFSTLVWNGIKESRILMINYLTDDQNII